MFYCMYISLYVMATSHSMRVYWLFTARVCACIDTVHACTGYGFPQYRYVFHSTGYGLPQRMCVMAVFTVHVCTDYVLPQQVCVLAVFTVCVYTGYVLPQQVCVLAVLQYVCVLVMVSHSTCVCYLFCSMWKYVCNEAYSHLIVNISYMLTVHGVVVGG